MLKNCTYIEKMQMLKEIFPYVAQDIKKDLKNEHLKNDRQFLKTYFTNSNLNKITVNELAIGYEKAIEKNEINESLADFITNRWLLKNSDLYDFYERKLTEISPNFTELELIEKEKATALMNDSITEFGAIKSYIFTVLNSVVFPEDILEILKTKAFKEIEELAVEKENKLAEHQAKVEERNQLQTIARLTDKYEKKITGLEKKYITDITALKKQISNLEQKLLQAK